MGPRSATDATRFTSTTPHVSAKLPPTSSSKNTKAFPSRQPGPPGETPQEKVKRLRAAANRAREADVSQFDKLIVRGRVWADRAHRFTALGLIAATFICGGVTFYALGDMMVHNRRKRAEFFTEQKALKASAIQTAKQALDQGVATEDQLAFLRREEEHDAQLAAAAKAKAAKKGIFKKSKEWLFSGLKKEEGVELAENNEREISHGEISEEGSSIKERASDVSRAIGQTQSAISDKTKGAFEEEKQRQRVGGPLDRLGTATESDMDEDKPKSGGWTSFMVRR